MARFIVRRVLWSLVTLLLMATIAFFAVNLLLPYDYAVGVGQRPQAVEEIRQQLGLDRPLVVRWLDYLWGLVRGDLGQSFSGPPVSSLVWDALPTTVAVFAVGGILAYLIGEWFGRLIAWSRNRFFGAASSAVSILLFTSFPPWLVFLLVYFGSDRLNGVRSLFGLRPQAYGPVPAGPQLSLLAAGLVVSLVGGVLLRGWARRRGYRALGPAAVPLCAGGFLGVVLGTGAWPGAADRLLWPSTVVATIALVLIAFGENLLVMRVGVEAEMSEDYVFTARAKGVPGPLIRDRHIAPNAVLPAITRLFTSVPYLIAGLIIIEWEVKLTGVASLFFYAIEAADVPIVLGVLVVVGLVAMVLRIVLGVVQAVSDPRLRAGAEPA